MLRGSPTGLALGVSAALALSGWSCASVLGLDVATHRGTGGNQGTAGGGDSGSGGSASNGGAGGTIEPTGGGGSQGSSGSNAAGSGGLSGAGGSSAAPDAGDASAPRDAGTDATLVGCQGKALCDDFESVTVGSKPDSMKWEIDPNTPPPIDISIDSSHPYRGKNSVRIQAHAGALGPMMFSNTVPLAVGNMMYIRVFLYMSNQSGNNSGSFLALRDAKDLSRYLVLGFNNGQMAYSFAQGANIGQPILPSGAAQLASSYKPTYATWICVEMRYDTMNHQIHTWVDDVDMAALRADGTATSGVDDTWMLMQPFEPTTQVGFGWWAQQGAPSPVYLDDVAVDSNRIGCN